VKRLIPLRIKRTKRIKRLRLTFTVDRIKTGAAFFLN
jgi:hypothetical protein